MNGSELTKLVMDYVEASGGKAINLIAASKAGNADIIACINGRYVELEIKGKGDTEKPHQAEKLNEAIKAGGYGAFIHSQQDLKKLLTLVYNNKPCPLVQAKIAKVTL